MGKHNLLGRSGGGSGLTRRSVLGIAGTTAVGAAAIPAMVAHGVQDDELRRSGDDCTRFHSFQNGTEPYQPCADTSGWIHRDVEADANGDAEAHLAFDESGTLRRRAIEEEDGEELLDVYDENGTLRIREEEDEDGDESREVYDENGILRIREEEDDDGDERREEYDENGILRFSRDEDDDGDVVIRTYDESGELIDVQRDDDDD